MKYVKSEYKSERKKTKYLIHIPMKKNTNETLISIKHLTKKIGKVTLLQNISFTLSRGEVF